MTRPTWIEYFMQFAVQAATRSTCLRQKVGAVIVKDKRILATGYNGAANGTKHCLDRGGCYRATNNVPSGHEQQMCYAVHAEQNAICQAARFGVPIEGSDLFCTHKPCSICAKLIVQTGIKSVNYLKEYPDELTNIILHEGCVAQKHIILIND